MYNGILVLDQARRRQSNALVHGVTWNCAAEFEAGPERPISFVEDVSYLILNSNSLYSLKLQLEMKTILQHSILLYNSAQLSKPDFFALELWKSKLRVTLKHLDKIIELTCDEYVSDGHWHKVSLKITTTMLELTVDSSTKTIKLPRKHVVEFSEVFYFGGIELSKRTRAMAKGLTTADTSYKGCLRHITLLDHVKGLPDVLVSEGVLPGCVWQYPCLKKPCEEGVCVQQGLDSFECLCKNEDCSNTYINETNKVFSRGNLANDLELLSLEPLEVLEGQNVLITTTNLHVILDYPKYGIRDFGIKFNIIEPPRHGSLTIDVWPHEKNSFTLSDIARDKVHYIHDGSEFHRDQIGLELEFSAGESFILPAYLQGKFKFNLGVNVTPVNDPPLLQIPTTSVFRIAEVSC